ncbi:MAG: tetratricopeptide repeat protein [Proteobacteria bacterium]|nr:tetratricopeptide repeat protein [Pseudomonadota bacterium]MCP4920224.1 tetratricopeptide repeat protein [Pseudomonadota bacterium]
MAVRATTLDLSDLDTFLEVHEQHLKNRTVVIPGSAVDGDELSTQFQLDIMLPFSGRQGPVRCNVLRVLPNGDTVAQVQEWPDAVWQWVENVFETIDRVRTHLLDSGEVIRPEDVPVAPPPVVQQVIVERPVAQPVAPTEDVVAPAEERRRTYGYELPDVLDREPLAAGTLTGRGLRDFLVDIALAETTGLLTVLLEDGTTRYGFWQDGGPVGWRTEPLREHETLGGLLLTAQKVTADQVAQALDIMDSEGCKQGEAFVRMGLLRAGQIPTVLKRQCEFLLQVVLREDAGSWAFFPAEDFPQRFAIPPVNVPQTLFNAMMQHSRNVTSDRLYAMLRPRLENRVRLRPTAEKIVRGFDWDAGELKFLDLIITDKPIRVRKLFSITPLTKAGTAGTIWAMNEMGFIDFGEGEQDQAQKLRRITAPIAKKLARVQEANVFDVLELHWICTGAEVETAWRKQRSRWDPTPLGNIPDELRAQLDAIANHLDKAKEALESVEARGVARRGLVGDEMVTQAVSGLAQRADGLLKERDKSGAIDAYQKALDLAPDDPGLLDGLARSKALMVVGEKPKPRPPV